MRKVVQMPKKSWKFSIKYWLVTNNKNNKKNKKNKKKIFTANFYIKIEKRFTSVKS